jgi:hypothetical protein
MQATYSYGIALAFAATILATSGAVAAPNKFTHEQNEQMRAECRQEVGKLKGPEKKQAVTACIQHKKGKD